MWLAQQLVSDPSNYASPLCLKLPPAHVPLFQLLISCQAAIRLQVSKMVFIGKDLDRQLIEEGFRECLVK